jgi:hypothetical protein
MASGFPRFQAKTFPDLIRVAADTPIEEKGDVLRTPNQIPPTPISPADLAIFEEQFRQHLTELLATLDRIGAQDLVVEGGHIYGDDVPTDRHWDEMRKTALLTAFLEKYGHTVTGLLFIDDYHPEKNTLDVDAYCNEAARLGWDIDHIVYENDMIPLADTMLKTLHRVARVMPEGDGFILNRGARRVHLKTPDKGDWSCALLDAALNWLKFDSLEAHAVINVLPRQWRGQQRNTRDILRAAFGHKALPYFNFFSDANGSAVTGAPHEFR